MTPEQEVEYLRTASYLQLSVYVASKIRKGRQLRNESQADFARRAGISLSTYKRFEAHGQGHLETFAKALIALDQSRYLHLLFPGEGAGSRHLSPLLRIQEIQENLLRTK